VEDYVVDGGVVRCVAQFLAHGEDVEELDVALAGGDEGLHHVVTHGDRTHRALQFDRLDWFFVVDVELGQLAVT